MAVAVIEESCVIAVAIGGVCVIVGASTEGVSGLEVIVDCAILAHFLGNAEVGAVFFLTKAGGWISIVYVSSKCCDCG